MTQAARQFSGIFISYRRDDSAGHAGRLFDRLVEHFGDDQVFMDIDHIEPGEDFVQVIEDGVGSCEILITVIGKRWLLSASGTSRRLDDPNDFVRLEIAVALQRNIRVIPVLVEGATMPRPQDLPDELSRLSRRQAIELSDQRWRHDISRLIATLEKVLAERKAAQLRAAQEEEERQRQAAAEEQRRQDEERSRLEAEGRRRLEEEEERQKREEEDERRKLTEEEKRKSEEAAAKERRRLEEEDKGKREAAAALVAEEERRQREDDERRKRATAEVAQRKEEEGRQEKERQAEEHRAPEARSHEVNLAARQKLLDESPTVVTAGDVTTHAYRKQLVMLIALGALVAIAVIVVMTLVSQKEAERRQQPVNQYATPTSSPRTALDANAPPATTPTPSPTPAPMPALDKAAFRRRLNAYIKTRIEPGNIMGRTEAKNIKVVYGDLNRDGAEDAASSYCVPVGMAALVCELAAFINEKGNPTHVDTFDGGDGNYLWALKEVQSINAGKIICSAWTGEGNTTVQKRFALVGNKLKVER